MQQKPKQSRGYDSALNQYTSAAVPRDSNQVATAKSKVSGKDEVLEAESALTAAGQREKS